MEDNPLDPLLPKGERKFIEGFQNTLKEIEKQHAEYFKNKKPIKDHRKQDRITDHFDLHFDGAKYQVVQDYRSDLDPKIKEQAEQFIAVFFQKQQ